MNIIENLALKHLGIDIDNVEQQESWKIENDSQADWALDKIREAQAEYRRFEMVVNDKISQLEAALAVEKEKMERETGFFQTGGLSGTPPEIRKPRLYQAPAKKKERPVSAHPKLSYPYCITPNRLAQEGK